MPLSGLGEDSLEGLRAAFSGLSAGGPEGKEKEKEKQAVDMGAKEVDPGKDTNHPMGRPLVTDLLRARRAPQITLQYPLQQPLHSRPHIQLHPHPQPHHLWLRV